MPELRTITTCAGIGDGIWMMQKLINSGERFRFILPDGVPQRGHQLFELLPQVAESCAYAANLGYAKVKQNNQQSKKKNWAEITDKKFYLSANEHLEQGKRIEDWLPDLPVSFKLDYATDADDKATARVLLTDTWENKYIGIYTSAYSSVRNWNGWDAAKWLRLIKMLYKGKNIHFVIVGATFDVGVVEDLIKGLKELGINHINTVGQPLSVVVEILKRLNYFIGFPSGLSILNETLGKDGVMMYKKDHQLLMNSWADPDRIANHNYKGCVFPEPEALYDWLKGTYKIFDKL